MKFENKVTGVLSEGNLFLAKRMLI